MMPDHEPELPPTATSTAATGPVSEPSWEEAGPGTTAASSMPPRPISPDGDTPRPGERLGDFELVAVLGKGAFATVFLARQTSLDRSVALKVSADRGGEARALAGLEHDHIVRVFSESVEQARGLRLLCMQYVNGTTLQQVIRHLDGRDRAAWSGQAILDAIAAVDARPELLDLAALRDRELLAASAFPEAVCWLGARISEALAHAHARGIFHRDVKPANILLNRYGRPFLADFNVSGGPSGQPNSTSGGIGGTLDYMAPEHLEAFNPEAPTLPEAVDARSDVYALGVVLHELLTGQSPFPTVPRLPRFVDWLHALAAQRRRLAPSPGQRAEVPAPLDAVVRRCLEAAPERRYGSAAVLASALDGCREQIQVMRGLPTDHQLIRMALRRPFLLGLVLLLLPHVLGSILNIGYNQLRIVEQLTPAQQMMFPRLVLAYNLLVYPAAVVVAIVLVRPLVLGWLQARGAGIEDEAQLAALRRRALDLPIAAAVLSGVGWLPGGLLFPLGLSMLAEPCGLETYGHFLLSFTVAGLIALTYSVYATWFIALRILYPHLWGSSAPRARARVELHGQVRWLAVLQLLAGLIPLVGAVMMVAVGPEEFGPGGYRPFRLLVTGLIGLGMAGFGMAMGLSEWLRQTVNALTGAGRAEPSRSLG